MACTVAVETVITQHYNDQLRVLQERGLLTGKYAELRQVFCDRPFLFALHWKLIRAPIQTIRKFRDDEEQHHDIGLAHKAEEVRAWL